MNFYYSARMHNFDMFPTHQHGTLHLIADQSVFPGVCLLSVIDVWDR